MRGQRARSVGDQEMEMVGDEGRKYLESRGRPEEVVWRRVGGDSQDVLEVTQKRRSRGGRHLPRRRKRVIRHVAPLQPELGGGNQKVKALTENTKQRKSLKRRRKINRNRSDKEKQPSDSKIKLWKSNKEHVTDDNMAQGVWGRVVAKKTTKETEDVKNVYLELEKEVEAMIGKKGGGRGDQEEDWEDPGMEKLEEELRAWKEQEKEMSNENRSIDTANKLKEKETLKLSEDGHDKSFEESSEEYKEKAHDSSSSSAEDGTGCGPLCRNRAHQEFHPQEDAVCPPGYIIDVWGYCRSIWLKIIFILFPLPTS